MEQAVHTEVHRMRIGALLSHSFLVLTALAAQPLVGCGGANSESTNSRDAAETGSAFALHGAYVPSALAQSQGEYASISFTTATTFTAVKSKCGGSSGCRVDGTYRYDGAHDLTLTDGKTSATEHLAVQTIATAEASSGDEQAIEPLDLVTGSSTNGSTGLVSTSGSALLPTIAAASIGGASMSHLDEDDPSAPTTSALVVPLTNKSGGVTVMLKVGRHGTPVEAMVDTGSSGIWISKSVLDPRDGLDQETTATAGYGNKQHLTGEVVSAFVSLGNVRTLGPIPVGVVSSETCSSPPCNDGADDIANITLAGTALHAVVGIGMDRTSARSGIVSPFGCMGQQTEQFVMSIGAANNTNSRLIVDPSSDDISDFTTMALTGDTDDGYTANVVPFCISGKCVNGLLDSGEQEAILAINATPANLALLQQTDAPTPAARGVQLVDPVTYSVLSIPNIPTSPLATSGTNVQLRPDGGNNLGILAFRGLDVFYDAWNGAVGVRPLTGEALAMP